MQEEFILCAATMYNGQIVPGFRHGDCNRLLENLLNLSENELPGREYQGFLTSKGRFVNRKEAFLIAKDRNQIWHKLHDETLENILTSEDLYY